MVNERVGDVSVMCFVDPRVELPQVFRRRVGGRTLSFEKTAAGLVDLETESRWSFDGVCIAGELEGSRLGQPDYRRAFWFAWAAFFPETEVARPADRSERHAE